VNPAYLLAILSVIALFRSVTLTGVRCALMATTAIIITITNNNFFITSKYIGLQAKLEHDSEAELKLENINKNLRFGRLH
jgi:hypothetical protein